MMSEKNIMEKATDAAVKNQEKADRKAASKEAKKAAAATRAADKKRSAAERREVKWLRQEYERRRKLTPEYRRPIICPPDRAGQDRKTVIIGYICRAFIIFIAVFGISFLICDALAFNAPVDPGAERFAGFGISAGFIALWSLIFTAIISAICTSKYGAIGGSLLIALIVILRLLPNPITGIYNTVTAVYNGVLSHLADAGYYAMNEHAIAVSYAESEISGYIATGVIFFTLIAAAIYVPCLIKRIRVIPPAIFSAALLVVVFVYNITRSNWGVALVIAAFSAILVMFVYDRIYIKKPDPDEYDTATVVFGEEAPPPLPEAIAEAQRKKQAEKEARIAAKKAKKAERRALRSGEKTITVEEELDEYFSTSKKKKPKKEKAPRKKLTPAEKKAAEAERKVKKAAEKQRKKEEREALARVSSFKNGIANARYAMGGFAGAGMFVLAMILLIIPAFATKENFTTIEAIDEKMDYYREYVTALLMGDDPVLDTLAYEGDQNNFLPHSTDATPITYYGTPIMQVDVNCDTNVYLRGWIGMDYIDGSWYTANSKSEEFAAYRELFSTTTDADESAKYNFYTLMYPDSIPDIDYTSKYKNNADYGFITMQVSMKRITLPSLLLYMPSFNLRTYNPVIRTVSAKNANALRLYGLSEASKLTYANYFDGIYTSFRASKDTEGYGVVSMVTTMTDSSFYRDVADLIAEYNEIRELIGGNEIGEFLVARSKTGTSDHSYVIEYSDGTSLSYSVEYDTETGNTIIRTLLTTGSAAGGTAVYTYDSNNELVKNVVEDVPPVYDEEGNVVDRFYAAPDLPVIIRYLELMTDYERSQVSNGYTLLDNYTTFVYNTYLDKSGSQIVTDLYNKIVSEATVEVKTVIETETTYDEIITYEPADFSRAAEHSEYTTKTRLGKTTYTFASAVTDSEVYEQRHKLVMEIINYLTDEEFSRYAYKTPSGDEKADENALSEEILAAWAAEDTSLSSIEKFLTYTDNEGLIEGYCVQYATALTLLLREAGIPARYVEGYVASDFNRNLASDAIARYTTTVRDWNAHAWVEVWYDGIGWVQYEATPVYYSDMYEQASSSSSSSVRPWYESDEEEEEEEPVVDPLTPEEEAELERLRQEAERRALILRILTISLSALAVIAIFVLFFGIMTRRAKKSQQERDRLLNLLAACGRRDAPLPERSDVRRVIDMISMLLAECGTTPKRGEFRDEYADRLADSYRGVLRVAVESEGMTEHESATTGMDTGAVSEMLDAIASEEFGYGAPKEAIPLLPRFYRRVYDGEYSRHVNIFRRLWLWLFRRAI